MQVIQLDVLIWPVFGRRMSRELRAEWNGSWDQASICASSDADAAWRTMCVLVVCLSERRNERRRGIHIVRRCVIQDGKGGRHSRDGRSKDRQDGRPRRHDGVADVDVQRAGAAFPAEDSQIECQTTRNVIAEIRSQPVTCSVRPDRAGKELRHGKAFQNASGIQHHEELSDGVVPLAGCRCVGRLAVHGHPNSVPVTRCLDGEPILVVAPVEDVEQCICTV